MVSIKFGKYQPTVEKRTTKGTDLILGIFFDGTGNNRKNARARKIAGGQEQEIEEYETKQDYIDAFNKNKSEKDSSYYNDESNISRLEQYYDKDDNDVFRVYVEGIGTRSLDRDSGRGLGTGGGETGIRGKIKDGCKTIAEKMKKVAIWDNATSSMLINSLTFDCYGFSRGAAAARHFVYQVNKGKQGYLGEALEEQNIVVKKIHIRFVGLFDTVASYGLIHTGDTFQLKLDHLRHAEKVVQLTAQDEIRYNFDLTDIRSAGKKGLTITLPGAHSDIGGGYMEEFTERNMLRDKGIINDIFYRKGGIDLMKYYYMLEGWYTEDQFDKGWIEIGGHRFNKLFVNRTISNKYSVIPLQIMARFSDESKAKINMTRLLEYFNTNDSDLLTEMHSRINKAIEVGMQNDRVNKIAAKARELVNDFKDDDIPDIVDKALGRGILGDEAREILENSVIEKAIQKVADLVERVIRQVFKFKVIECIPFDRERNIRERGESVVDKFIDSIDITNSYPYTFDYYLMYNDNAKNLVNEYESLCSICDIFKLKKTKKELNNRYKRLQFYSKEQAEVRNIIKSLEQDKDRLKVKKHDLPPTLTEGDDSDKRADVELEEVVAKGFRNLSKYLRYKFLHVSHHYRNSAIIFEPHEPQSNYKRNIQRG
ncbi:MAG: phospholipase effector Tle1 domain-containing protein [Bacteroidales bacterium]